MRSKTSLAVVLFFSAGAALAAPPPWPPLEQQLARDRIVPGSALERLIQANQDFRLLRREEASDGLGIPLWLRVFWRKAHPEIEDSADDPTHGYPLVLHEIHAWMLAHQDLLPGPPEKIVLPRPSRVAVGPNLRISGAQATSRSESDVRIDVWHPQRIIAASNNIGGSGLQGQYWSSDTGLSWGQTVLPLVTGDALHSDPTVDWDSNGNAWSTTLGIAGGILRLRTYKSTNGGQTWVYDSLASGTQTAVDKQMVWIDHGATSPYRDTTYAIWHNGPPAFMNRRVPGGNWDTPIQVSGSETTGSAIGGDATANAYGDVFGFWPDTGSRRLLVTKSTNGGASYSTPVTIATTYGSFGIKIPSFAGRDAHIILSAGAWRTATKNMAYASWTDLSGEAGCTTGSQAPGTNASSFCKTRIWFSRSTDGGSTWTTPVKINDSTCPNDQFNPRLVVDETNGTLGIIYYDTSADPIRTRADVWYQVSFSDGSTWHKPVRVTSASTDETVAGADLLNQYGDYNGLSAYARVIFSSWTDRRNYAKEEIWTTHIDEPAKTFHASLNPPPSRNPLCGRLQVFACDMDRNASSTFLGRAYVAGSNAPTTITPPFEEPEEPGSLNQTLVAAFGPGGYLWWSKTYGYGDARAVAVDSQGTVVAATTMGVLLLSAANGNLLASYLISDWMPQKIAFDPSDNIYVTGYEVPTKQVYTVRLDRVAGGGLALSPGWPQRFGTAYPPIGISEGRAIAVRGSAVYVAGQTVRSSTGEDALVLKYPLTGGAPAAQFLYDGSVEYPSTDALNDLVVDSGGNVFATGYASGIVESAGEDFDYLTLRLNSGSFGTAWIKRFDAGRLIAGGMIYLSTDKATFLAFDPAGQSVYVTGSSHLNGNSDIRTLKYGAADGATTPDWRFDSAANDAPSGLFVSSAGQVFIGGLSGNQFALLARSGDLLTPLYETPAFIATTTLSGGFSGTVPTVACLAGRSTAGTPALFSGGFYRNDCLCDPIAATGIQWIYP